MMTPIEKTSILVTGAGAVIGQGIIKSLKASGSTFRIIAMDMNPNAVGFAWADVSYQVPRADSDDWCSAICRICNCEGIRLILPGIEQDVRAFIRHRERIGKETAAVVLINSDSALEVGFDKWHLYRFSVEQQIIVPPTCLASDDNGIQALLENPPLLFKPRAGMAGKGIIRVNRKDELDNIRSRIEGRDYICQQYIGHDDEEYTASCFGNMDGTVSGPIIFRRRLNYGSTFEAETVDDEGLSNIIRNISSHLSIIGPTNFQFRKTGGEYMLIEVNPRFSSSTSIKTAFGFNEPYMAVQNYVSGISLPEIIPLQKGRCSRYIRHRI